MSLGFLPRVNVLVAEGRLSALATGERDDSRLLPVSALLDAERHARESFGMIGVDLRSRGRVRRYDLAGELCFEEGADGLDFLRAAAAGLHLPRLTQRQYRFGAGALQSIEWITPTRLYVRLRMYDAGVRHGTHRAGERVRVEREVRVAARDQRTADAVAASDLSHDFIGPLERWLRSASPIQVAASNEATQLVIERIRRGEMTTRRADSLVASAVYFREAPDLLSARQRNHRLRRLRHHGVFLDVDGVESQRQVDLRPMLTGLAERWTVPASESLATEDGQ